MVAKTRRIIYLTGEKGYIVWGRIVIVRLDSRRLAFTAHFRKPSTLQKQFWVFLFFYYDITIWNIT